VGGGHAWKLSPVDEQAEVRALLRHAPGFREPFGHPARPRPLVFGIDLEIGKRVSCFNAGICLRCEFFGAFWPNAPKRIAPDDERPREGVAYLDHTAFLQMKK